MKGGRRLLFLSLPEGNKDIICGVLSGLTTHKINDKIYDITAPKLHCLTATDSSVSNAKKLHCTLSCRLKNTHKTSEAHPLFQPAKCFNQLYSAVMG